MGEKTGTALPKLIPQEGPLPACMLSKIMGTAKPCPPPTVVAGLVSG